MGVEILSSTRCGSGDFIRTPPHAEQCGVDPAGSEIRTKDFSCRVDLEFLKISAEVDFPAVRPENAIGGLPFLSQMWQQPETHGLISIARLDMEAQAGIGESTELPERSDDDGAVTTGGFLRPMVGGHFRQDPAGERFLDF